MPVTLGLMEWLLLMLNYIKLKQLLIHLKYIYLTIIAGKSLQNLVNFEISPFEFIINSNIILPIHLYDKYYILLHYYSL